MPEVNVTAADTSALDVEQNLALLEVTAALDLVESRLRLCHPQVVGWVCVDANVGLGRLDLCHCCAHDCGGCEVKGGIERKEKEKEKTRLEKKSSSKK
jgi:hypothetical protein